MAVLKHPWRRVKDPVAIPDPVEKAALRGLSTVDFARLLRDHLVPRHATGPERDRWNQLWGLLARDEQLAERAFDVLEEFLDEVQDALEDDQLEDQDRRRAQKFARFLDDAWKRLQVDDARPLGWAGRAALGFNPPARHVIEQLVDAIADHRNEVSGARAPRAEDEALWKVLAQIGLDPMTSRRRR